MFFVNSGWRGLGMVAFDSGARRCVAPYDSLRHLCFPYFTDIANIDKVRGD